MITFGDKLKSLRESHNLSQKEFANILKIANSTLSQYESNKRVPSDEIKLQIAQYFNVSTDYLLGNEVKKDINRESKEGSKIQTIAAHLDGDITEEEMHDIIKYVEFIKSKRK